MDLKQERRLQQRQSQAGLFDIWILRIKRWLNRLFNPVAVVPAKIERTFESPFIFLKLIQSEYSDEYSTRIRYWVAVSKHPDLPVDVVITCDKIKRPDQERLAGDLTRVGKEIRIGVFFISKYLIGNRREKTTVMVVDLDCAPSKIFKLFDVNASNQVFIRRYTQKVDAIALKVVDSLALQLVSKDRKFRELKLLMLLEDGNDFETSNTRKAVGDRWLEIVTGYYEKIIEEEK